MKRQHVTATLLCLACLSGCSEDDKNLGGQVPPPATAEDDSQQPPTGEAAVEAWLAEGKYKAWKCESAVHASRSPSPHGFNRICSNDLVADNATGTGAWPKGAAAVKELYDSAQAKQPMGYSVYLKVDDDSAGGANWYWYERIGSEIIADGLGNEGRAKSICVSCHSAAGADAAHTPTPGARDQVYTPVE